MTPPSPPRRAPKKDRTLYLPGLDASLPDHYDSELFIVGHIAGLLETLATLNEGQTNLSPSLGLLEIEVGARGPLAALRERYSYAGAIELVPLGDDFRSLALSSLRAHLDRTEFEDVPTLDEQRAITASVVERLSELFSDCVVDVYALGGARIYGYIYEETLAFVLDEQRVFVLGVGWSD